MKASVLAQQALDHLRESAWLRGRLGVAGGIGGHRHCLAGAAICSTFQLQYGEDLDVCTEEWRRLTSRPEWETWERMLVEITREQYPDSRPTRIVNINDHLPLDKEELEALVEKTIARLEEKGQ